MTTSGNVIESQLPETANPSEPRLFTAKAISVGAFIGGPLAATALIGRNFDKLGFKRSRNRTYLLGLGLTLSYLWLILSIPSSVAERIPNAAYAVVVSFIAYTLTENLQGKLLKRHFDKLGEKASGWAVAGWSLLSGAVTLGLVVLYLPMIPPFDFEEKAYAEGLLGNEIYHSDGIDEETLRTLGAYLIEVGYFDSNVAAAIQLLEEDGGYHLTLPCIRSLWDDQETMAAFKDFGKELEANALFQPVTLSLVDANFAGTYRKRL